MSKDDIGEVRNGASSKEIRKARVRRLVRRLGLWVVIPTLLGIIYYGFVAAPQYDSVALIRVQSKGGGGKAKTTKVNAMLVREYLLSRAMLEKLDTKRGIKEHFQKGGDLFSGLSSDASSEELYEYYREKVIVERRGESGSLKLTVRAFSGEAAQGLALAMLAAAEGMTNATDQPAKEARLAHAVDAVTTAETELETAQLAFTTMELAESSTGKKESGEMETTVENVAKLEMLRYKQELARKNYETALKSQQKLHTTLAGEQLYLAVISPPSLATGSAHPRRLWGILTVFVLSIVMMGVFTMLGSALKEHARF